MKTKNLPVIGARYWAAIVAASMCGANMGDFASRNLHLGHTRGLLPLLALFLLILWFERRAVRAWVGYYWLAIIVIRTAATNLADLATSDLKLGFIAVQSGLTALLVAILLAAVRTQPAPAKDPARTLPATDLPYWLAMLTAGTLGTALGDGTADTLGLALGSIVLAAAFALVLLLSVRLGHMSTPWYWLTIVAARTVGTTLGDYLASRRGLALGLPISLACTGSLLLAILVFWPTPPPHPQARPA